MRSQPYTFIDGEAILRLVTLQHQFALYTEYVKILSVIIIKITNDLFVNEDTQKIVKLHDRDRRISQSPRLQNVLVGMLCYLVTRKLSESGGELRTSFTSSNAVTLLVTHVLGHRSQPI